MKGRKFSVLCIVLVLMMLVPAVLGAAGEDKVYTIKLPSISVDFTSLGGKTIMNFNYAAQLAFKNYVETESAGRMKVEIYTNAALGKGPEILQQCMQGILEATTTGESDLSSYYPALQVFSIPYTFQNRTEYYNFLDSDYMQSVYDDIAKKTNIRIISSFDNGGFRNFSNNVRPIKTAADLKGLSIRSMQNSAHVFAFKSLGAVPTALAYSELYSALQTGVVDGQENSPMVLLDGSVYEVQKYYTLDGHMVSPAYIAVNEKWLNSLPEDLKKVVLDGGRLAQTAARGAIVSGEAIALEIIRAGGVQIYAPNPEEKATFQIAKEPVINWLKEQIGATPVDEFLKAVDEAKKGAVDKQEVATVAPTQPTAVTNTPVVEESSSALLVPFIVVSVLLVISIAFIVVKITRKKKKA